MNQKPGDLLLNVIDFFGIVVPGAVLVFLHGNFLLTPFGLSVGALQTPSDWIPAFFVAYVLGQFLLGFSVKLNDLAVRHLKPTTLAYANAIRRTTPNALPPETADTDPKLFYAADAAIRLGSPEAIAELDRQKAEYKLFRSLTLLFLLDVPLSIVSGLFSPLRLVAALLMAALSAYRYYFLFDYTYQLAFLFYLLLPKTTNEEKEQT